MAAGYVIAVVLEIAGLVALAIGAFVIRTERQTRAAGLRGFLRSGHTSNPEGRGARRASGASAPRRVAVPAGTAQDALAARKALRRAFPA